MAQYSASATGQWTIYSVQKNLSSLAFNANHNYLVLVDPQGNAVLEMHGLPSNSMTFSPTAGNYLQAKMYVPNEYLPDNSVLSVTPVMTGNESSIFSTFNNAFNAVANALNTNECLYAADPSAVLDFSDAAYNSNSVWYTAMLTLQASAPSQITNPIASYVVHTAPGDTLDLTAAGSNNPLVTSTSTDPSFVSNPTQDDIRHTIVNSVSSPNPVVLLTGGVGYMLGVMNQAQNTVLYYLVSSDAVFASGDNGWENIASQVSTLNNTSVTAAQLQQINAAFSVNDLTPGTIIHVPLYSFAVSASTNLALTPLSSGENYVFDPASHTMFVVGGDLNTTYGEGALIIDQPDANGHFTSFKKGTYGSVTLNAATSSFIVQVTDPNGVPLFSYDTDPSATFDDGVQIDLPYAVDLTLTDNLASGATSQQLILDYLTQLAGDNVIATDGNSLTYGLDDGEIVNVLGTSNTSINIPTADTASVFDIADANAITAEIINNTLGTISFVDLKGNPFASYESSQLSGGSIRINGDEIDVYSAGGQLQNSTQEVSTINGVHGILDKTYSYSSSAPYTVVDYPASLNNTSFTPGAAVGGVNDSGVAVAYWDFWHASNIWFDQPGFFAVNGQLTASIDLIPSLEEYYDVSNISYDAFYWENATINNAGAVVGSIDYQQNRSLGFIYQNGQAVFFQDPDATNYLNFTYFTAISNNGLIAGYSGAGSFIYNGGSFTRITDAASEMHAYGINNDAVTVGDALIGFQKTAGFVDDNGQITYLRVPDGQGGFCETHARSINDAGTIVGNYYDQSGKTHGFVYKNGTYTTVDNPDPSPRFGVYLTNINDNDVVSGYYLDEAERSHGFVAALSSLVATQVTSNFYLEGNGNIDLASYQTVGSTVNLAAGDNNVTFGVGSNTVNGALGATTYNLSSIFAQDVINNAQGGNTSASGSINFTSNAITNQNLWLAQNGDDLVIRQLGTSQTVTVTGWFGNDAGAQVQNITLTDGGQLSISAVQILVAAMTNYQLQHPDFDASSETVMPSDNILQTIIDFVWNADDIQNYSVLTTGADTVLGDTGNDLIIAMDGTLNAGDAIDGGDGANILLVQGAGTFDLNTPSSLVNISVIDAEEGQEAYQSIPSTRQTFYLRDGLDATVNVIDHDAVNPDNPNESGITIIGANNNDVVNLGSGVDTYVLNSAFGAVHGKGDNDILTVTGADITNVEVDGLYTLNVSQATTLTHDQFDGFSNFEADDGASELTVSLIVNDGGTYDLSAKTVAPDTVMSLDTSGSDADGVTLIGGTGDEVLITGNGAGDVIYAGAGVNTITVGTGLNDTIHAADGLAAGSSITVLETTTSELDAEGDISGATISGIHTLSSVTGVTLTATQLNGFSSIAADSVLYAATGGTYNVSGKTTSGNTIYATASTGTTLQGSNASSMTLVASATGNDSLIIGSGANTVLDASNTSGSVSLSSGSGSNNLLNVSGSTGNVTVSAGGGNNAVIDARGSTGTDTLSIGGGASGTIYAGLGVDTITTGSGANDTVIAENGLAAGSSMTMHTSTSTLRANGDISGATLSGVHTLGSTTGVTLTSSQLAGVALLEANTILYAATSGSYSMSGGRGTSGDTIYATSNSGTTLIAGNAASNTLHASASGNDTLTAGNGNNDVLDASSSTGNIIMTAGNGSGDILKAGSGNDTMTGGNGNTSYIFGSNFGQDSINNVGTSGTTAHGEIDFGSYTSSDLWFEQVGNNLQIDLLGSSDHLTVNNWFGSNAAAQVGGINTSDSLHLDSQVAQLVQAMASYTGNNSGFDPTTATAMPTDTTLQTALAASWHS